MLINYWHNDAAKGGGFLALTHAILAIRDQGGIMLKNGDRLVVDPIIVGRDRDKIEALAKKHNVWLDMDIFNPPREDWLNHTDSYFHR